MHITTSLIYQIDNPLGDVSLADHRINRYIHLTYEKNSGWNETPFSICCQLHTTYTATSSNDF